MSDQTSKGFLGELFDVNFSNFITTKVIKVLFILAIIGNAIWALVILGGGLASGKPAQMIGGVILAPLAFFLGVLLTRVYLELIIVLFRIDDDVRKIAQSKTSSAE